MYNEQVRRNNKESISLHGKVIFGKGRYLEEITDAFGNKTYKTKFEEILYQSENIIPIGGYQFIFNKLFNIGLDKETTLRVGDLNDEAPQMKIGVPRSEYQSIHYDSEASTNPEYRSKINTGINISANNFVFGFMIGDGGARENNITAIAPNYKNRTLFHAIPFRMSNDGYDMENGKYFGKYISSPDNSGERITSYYVKKFDKPDPHIIHSYVSDNPNELEIVDDSVFFSTSSTPIESIIELPISVSKYDLRGYFNTNGTVPKFNEFALVSGWYNAEKDDYESIRLFTKHTRSSVILADNDEVEAMYVIYAR